MKSILVKLVVIAAICGLGYFIFINLPKTTVESSRASEFVLNKPFKDVQKSLRRGNFEQETLRINGATVLDKKWIDKNFHMERILRKDRYWEFRGRLQAKVQVDNPRAGKLTVDLVEEVEFAIDHITINTTLVKPLDVGVTDMRESISILPLGDSQCQVKLTVYLKLQRWIPKNYKDFAQREMDGAADDAIAKMTAALQNMRY